MENRGSRIGSKNLKIPWVAETFLARFPVSVKSLCQVFIVTRFAARGFGLRPKMCRALTDTENSRRTRGKPLVPREIWARNCR